MVYVLPRSIWARFQPTWFWNKWDWGTGLIFSPNLMDNNSGSLNSFSELSFTTSLDALWMRSWCNLDVAWMLSGCNLDAAWMRSGCDLDAIWMRFLNTIFDILEPSAFQKYSTCWVFSELVFVFVFVFVVFVFVFVCVCVNCNAITKLDYIYLLQH